MTMARKELFELVNLVGSVAGITGVSLVTASNSLGKTPANILAVVVTATLLLGIGTLAVGFARGAFVRYSASMDGFWKVGVLSLLAGFALLAGWAAFSFAFNFVYPILASIFTAINAWK